VVSTLTLCSWAWSTFLIWQGKLRLRLGDKELLTIWKPQPRDSSLILIEAAQVGTIRIKHVE
jgi:hypothetical protein